MRNIKLFSFFALVGMLSLASCKNDGSAAKDEARESLASTASTTPTKTDASTATKKANEPTVPTGPLTSILFDEDSFDYGEIMEGEDVIHVYKFKNTGKEPLIISNAKGSCGCTVPEWPREPIAVGGSGEIRVKFSSKGKGKVGGATQSKRVTIMANTDPQNTYLTIKGKVNKEEAKPAG